MEWGLPGAGGGGNEELLFNGYRVSVSQDEKDSVVGRWSRNKVHLTPLDGTLKHGQDDRSYVGVFTTIL